MQGVSSGLLLLTIIQAETENQPMRYGPGRMMEGYQKDHRTAGRRALAWKLARTASTILKEK
jgi:hypothetical protein